MSTTVNGQYLLDEVKIRLASLANAYTVDMQLSFINEGIAEVWAVLKSLDLDYFTDSTQDTLTSSDDYFVDLNTSQREYDLPPNCRELRFIECLTSGFQDRIFEYRKLDDPIFQAARREATAQGPDSPSDSGAVIGNYYYTVFGTQLMLAQYPETSLQVKLWYIKSLSDITDITVPLSDMLFPFSKKIIDYAVERVMLTSQNIPLGEAWLASWKESVKTLAMSAGLRSSTNPIFVADYTGE